MLPPRDAADGGTSSAASFDDEAAECLPFVIVPSLGAAAANLPPPPQPSAAAVFILGPDLSLMHPGALSAAVADIAAHLRQLVLSGRARRGWIVACASDIQRLREIRGLIRTCNDEATDDEATGASPPRSGVTVGYMALPYGNHETLCDLLTAVKAGVEMSQSAAATVGVVMAREVARPMADNPDYAIGSLFATTSLDSPRNVAAIATASTRDRFELIQLPWALDHTGMPARALGYTMPTKSAAAECDEASERVEAVFSATIKAGFDAVLPPLSSETPRVA